MSNKRSHSRSLVSRRAAWVPLIFACVAAFVVLQGCGPAVPKEELGEVLMEVPSEFYFDRPYPVPWAMESGETEPGGDESEVAEETGEQEPANSSLSPAEAQGEHADRP